MATVFDNKHGLPPKFPSSTSSNSASQALLSRREQTQRPLLVHHRPSTPVERPSSVLSNKSLAFQSPSPSENGPLNLSATSSQSSLRQFSASFSTPANNPFAPLQQYNNALKNQWKTTQILGAQPASQGSTKVTQPIIHSFEAGSSSKSVHFAPTIQDNHDPYARPMSVSDIFDRPTNLIQNSLYEPQQNSQTMSESKENSTNPKSITSDENNDSSNVNLASILRGDKPANFTINAFLRRQSTKEDERASVAPDGLPLSSAHLRRPLSGNRARPTGNTRLIGQRPASANPAARIVELSFSVRTPAYKSSSLVPGSQSADVSQHNLHNSNHETSSSSFQSIGNLMPNGHHAENIIVPQKSGPGVNISNTFVKSSNAKQETSSVSGTRMPVTGTVTGTVFYRKSVNCDEFLYGSRSKADGAIDKVSVVEPSIQSETSGGLSLYQQVKKEVELHRQLKQQTLQSQTVHQKPVIGTNSESSPSSSKLSNVGSPGLPNIPSQSQTNTSTAQAQATTAQPTVLSMVVASKPPSVSRLSVTSAKGEPIAMSPAVTSLVYSGLQPIRPMSAIPSGGIDSKAINSDGCIDSFLGERQPGDGEAEPSEEAKASKALRSRSVPPPQTSKPDAREDNRCATPMPPETEEMVPENTTAPDDDQVSVVERLAARRRPQSCTPVTSQVRRGSNAGKNATSGSKRRSSKDTDTSDDDDDDDNQQPSATTSSSSMASSSTVKKVVNESTTTSTPSTERKPKLRARSASVVSSRKSSASSEGGSRPSKRGSVPQSALIPSLFPNTPPVIHFVEEGETIEALCPELRKLLKWRMNPITPLVVKHTVTRSGFKAAGSCPSSEELEGNESNEWIGYFGRHMRSATFKTIKEHQKVNHFPGSFQLGRKDRLWINLHKMSSTFGRKDFSFFPQTFVMPADQELFRMYWEDGGGHKETWIIKPPASARGNGIRVVSKWNQIPKKRSMVVQKYIDNPYLINDSKFDLRIYVYVTSFDPLRIYLHEEGLVRFASQKYSNSSKTLVNRFVHLTNYSVNKYNTEYQNNTDKEACTGHKWSLKALWNYLRRQGCNPDTVWEKIKDLVVKTMISAEATIRESVRENCRRSYCVHELFGIDVLLDESLKPWILEVNISPSLHSDSPLDLKIKGAMIKDLLNLAGYQLPDIKWDTHSNSKAPHPSTDLSNYTPSSKLVTDRRLWSPPLLLEERAKQTFFEEHFLRENRVLDTSLLERLTPADVRWLAETLDEGHRAGGFQCLFPTPATSARYLRFFDTPAYSSLVLVAFFQKYARAYNKGLDLVRGLCRKKIHLISASNSSIPLPSMNRWGPVIPPQSSDDEMPSRSLQRTQGGGDL